MEAPEHLSVEDSIAAYERAVAGYTEAQTALQTAEDDYNEARKMPSWYRTVAGWMMYVGIITFCVGLVVASYGYTWVLGVILATTFASAIIFGAMYLVRQKQRLKAAESLGEACGERELDRGVALQHRAEAAYALCITTLQAQQSALLRLQIAWHSVVQHGGTDRVTASLQNATFTFLPGNRQFMAEVRLHPMPTDGHAYDRLDDLINQMIAINRAWQALMGNQVVSVFDGLEEARAQVSD